MDVLQVLTDAGAVSSDRHFVYTSGKHGSTYINLDPLLPDIVLMTDLCRELATPFVGDVEVVAAPAVGAIVLAVLTAQALSAGGNRVPAVWADKTGDGDFAFTRVGFGELLSGRRVLVVEDLITTGGSVAKVSREAERIGAHVVGVSAVCNRGGATAKQLSVPRLHVLAEVDFTAFPPDTCPLCVDAVPVVEDIGHGSEFRLQHPGYPGGFMELATWPGVHG